MDAGYKVVGSVRMVLAYPKWGWDLLFHLSFFHHRHYNYSYSYYPAQHDLHENYEPNDVVSATGEDLQQSSECAVCLSKVEEGDEIRELTCRHVFHRVCLDRWSQSFGRRQPTCPVCRRSLTTRATSQGSSSGGREGLLFDFARFVSSDHDTRDTWWLR